MNYFEDITIAVCFYNTPYLIEPFLKSFIYHHPEVEKFNFLISDNSTNPESEKILKKNNIFYIRNPGMTHNPSVDILFEKVKTKYVLLCDSDILIMKNLNPLIELFFKNNLASMGEIQFNRASYKFVCPRVAPYWNLINLQEIKAKNIKFYDPERVKASKSEGFFANVPLQNNLGGTYYDTGTSFFQDITKHGLKIGKINSKLVDYVKHYEAMSWDEHSNIPGFINRGKETKKRYLQDCKEFDSVSIKDKFVYEF